MIDEQHESNDRRSCIVFPCSSTREHLVPSWNAQRDLARWKAKESFGWGPATDPLRVRSLSAHRARHGDDDQVEWLVRNGKRSVTPAPTLSASNETVQSSKSNSWIWSNKGIGSRSRSRISQATRRAPKALRHARNQQAGIVEHVSAQGYPSGSTTLRMMLPGSSHHTLVPVVGKKGHEVQIKQRGGSFSRLRSPWLR